ncbi:unnamed protein product [Meloidogyne enterolobii]|uniref:Uncharacterized protein n=1 Tax=Meloidogyne enterolobii TaxID=390850 RepID=A0ACB0Y607_MELEN
MPNIFVKIMNNGRNLDCSWPSILVWLSLFFATFIFIKFLIFYWNKNELKRLQKSKLIKKILLQHDDNQKCFKQNGRFSPVKMSKRRKNRGGGGGVGDCLNEFRRMFLEYSGIFYSYLYSCRPDSRFPNEGIPDVFFGLEIPEIEKFIFQELPISRNR